jgi:hypothetical protein
MPIPRDEQKKYKSLAKIGQFFTELKFNKKPREAIFLFYKKKLFFKYSSQTILIL